MEVADEVLDNLQIPGLKSVLTSNRNVQSRVVWGFAIFLSIAIFGLEMGNRITYFKDKSKSVRATVVESTEPLEMYPKITVCNSHMNYIYKLGIIPNTKRLQTSIDALEREPYFLCRFMKRIISHIYRDLTVPLKNIRMTGQTFELSDWIDIPFNISRFPSQLGPCITLFPKINSNLKKLKLQIEDTLILDKFNGYKFNLYKLYIHEENVPPTPEWLIKHSSLHSNEPLVADIHTTQFKNLNRSSKLCVSKRSYEECRQDCLQQAYDQSYCQLPYGEISRFGPRIIPSLPECIDPFLCTQAVTQIKTIVDQMNGRSCNCVRKCQELLYNVQLSRGLSNKFRTTKLPTAEFQLNFASYTVVEEQVAYNFISLLSDIGGILGLTIGLSVLGMMETVSVLMKWLKLLKAKSNSELPHCDSKGITNEIIPEVSIPGIDVLFGRHSTTKKALWLFALIASVIISSLQIEKHWQYLLHNSTAVSVTIGPNQNLNSPYFTICPFINVSDWSYHPRLARLLEIYENHMNKTLTNQCDVLKAPRWNATTNSPHLLTQPNSWSKIQGKIRYIGTEGYHFEKIYGFCHALKPILVYQQFQFFHDVNVGMRNGDDWNFPGSPEKFLFERLNLPSSPCLDSGSVNAKRAACLLKRLEKEMPCQFPKSGLKLVPLCTTIESCKAAYSTHYKILSEFNWDQCNPKIPPLCSTIVYQYSKFAIPHPYQPPNDDTEIRLQFQDLVIKHVEQYQSYTVGSLLCDAGSIIGVTMGACLLTVFQVMELLVFGLRSISNNRPVGPLFIIKRVPRKKWWRC